LDGLEPWVQRLTDSVGFRAVRQEVNWPNVEAELGIELPKDYKELVEIFGGGVISRTAIIYTTGPGDPYDLVRRWRSLETSCRENPWSRSRYQPYEFFRPDSPGLLEWGSSTADDRYYWLVDPVGTKRWPILALSADWPPFYQFDMTASEFIWRIACEEEFSQFGVARHMQPPTFDDPEGNTYAAIGSRDGWP
jgi:hypothetical protein